MHVTDDVEEIITRLGQFDHSYALAKFLVAEGAHGKRGKVGECVLSNYLQCQTGIRCGVGRTGTRVPLRNTFIEHPPVVRDFVKLFDYGYFPLLESEVYRERQRRIFLAEQAERHIIPVTEAVKAHLRPWLTGMGDDAVLPGPARLLTARETMVLELLQSRLTETAKECADTAVQSHAEESPTESTLTCESLAVLC